MEQQVILKSNRYGINLILNENLPFEELLDAIILKMPVSRSLFPADTCLRKRRYVS